MIYKPTIIPLLLIVLTAGFAAPLTSLAQASSCPPGQHFVRSHFRNAYTTSTGKFVKATTVKSHCRRSTPSYEFWSPRLYDGLPPGWPHQSEESSTWTEEQKQRFLDILEDLPEEFRRSTIKGIYRLKKSKDHPNPASNGDGYIVLYDNAFEKDRNLGRIFSHEISHDIYDHLDRKTSKDYRDTMDWTVVVDDRTLYWQGRKNGYVEEDGRNSPAEDFSNNMEYYQFNPKRLNEVSPKAYNWMKKHYGDKLKTGSIK
ncbi:hypothetical protein [Bdellovibrio sp. BCCA]|uniref:hypothetical protein n=1 Tax=Bdellovibrio sp. BCCA TaxID=3136281 RepID=UPI0030F22080